MGKTHLKLKRFLLRYDPPGIGLEVEDDDELQEVRHRTLPPTISSSQEVYTLADALIAGETEVSLKKHRSALIQSLAKLYNVEADVDLSEPESAENQKRQHNNVKAKKSEKWAVGQRVVLIGFEGPLQVHNGAVGTLLKVNSDKDKCEVQILEPQDKSDVASTVKIKSLKHLVPVAAQGSSVSVGAPVVICGLRNHAELNGWLGLVVECFEDRARYVVRAIESGQHYRVKRDNLLPIQSGALGMVVAASAEFASKQQQQQQINPMPPAGPKVVDRHSELYEPGTMVVLVGLKTSTRYNGQKAEVLSVDRARALYEIRLSDGTRKTVNAVNTKQAGGNSKSDLVLPRAIGGSGARTPGIDMALR